MNKRHYEHTLPNIRGSLSNTYEGTDMGLETGSVPGLSCGLYGSVDFGEDYREVTGRLAVPEKLYVYVVPFEIRSLLKSWKTSFGNVFRTIPRHGTVMTLDIRP